MPRAAIHRDKKATHASLGNEVHELVHTYLEPWFASLYLLAGVFFVIGSIWFFPQYEAYYSWGCTLFLAGGLIYFVESLYDLENALVAKEFYEAVVTGQYTLGGSLYLAGTVLFYPSIAKDEAGTWCFIIGSLLFCLAAFTNGAHAALTEAPSTAVALLSVSTSCSTMIGCIFFTIGSFLYLEEFSCSSNAFIWGTWLFVLGSFFFVLAAVFPLVANFVRPPSPSLETGDANESKSSSEGPIKPLLKKIGMGLL